MDKIKKELQKYEQMHNRTVRRLRTLNKAYLVHVQPIDWNQLNQLIPLRLVYPLDHLTRERCMGKWDHWEEYMRKTGRLLDDDTEIFETVERTRTDDIRQRATS